MNTKGPNGGKAAPSGTKTTGTTVRTTAFQDRAHAYSMVGSKNSAGQRVQYGSSAKVRQASVNSGPMTEISVTKQRVGRTSPPAAPVKQNRNSGQPRSYQNSMTGDGPTGV